MPPEALAAVARNSSALRFARGWERFVKDQFKPAVF
jgi:hypothetical protein